MTSLILRQERKEQMKVKWSKREKKGVEHMRKEGREENTKEMEEIEEEEKARRIKEESRRHVDKGR